METTALATVAFDNYIDVINDQLDRTLLKAQAFDETLQLIISKIETIQDLIKKGKQINDESLDRLLQDSFWTWLFGKDVVSIRKHQRNIKTLTEFNDFIRKLSSNVGDIIGKLLQFKNGATDLKETAADLKTSQYKSPERQLKIIAASLKRLDQTKQAFEKKLLENKTQ